jgi:ankyrin repeat protein
LLQNGLNPNCYDTLKALPILYAAVNSQFEFIIILRKYRSEVNICSIRNEIPFIEIIKRSRNFSIEQIQQLLSIGMDPNYLDMNRRNSLHHLVFNASNLDNNP